MSRSCTFSPSSVSLIFWKFPGVTLPSFIFSLFFQCGLAQPARTALVFWFSCILVSSINCIVPFFVEHCGSPSERDFTSQTNLRRRWCFFFPINVCALAPEIFTLRLNSFLFQNFSRCFPDVGTQTYAGPPVRRLLFAFGVLQVRTRGPPQ